MKLTPVNFREKFDKFTDYWSPKIIAQMNEYHFKLVKFEGEFVWHQHDDTDEVFIVISGEMSIELRDGTVHLKKGDYLPCRRVSNISRSPKMNARSSWLNPRERSTPAMPAAL